MNLLRQMALFHSESEASPLTEEIGFIYRPDFITPELEALLIEQIDRQPWDTTWKRRVQQYGFSYSKYRSSHQSAIPHWLIPLSERLAAEGFFTGVPNQILVNEYLPGQGIAAHSDYPTTGPIVASLSLGAPIVMDFTDPDGKKHPHLLERRSLFVLSGEARYQWKHGIAARKFDNFLGNHIERKRRISCTFRNTLSG